MKGPQPFNFKVLIGGERPTNARLEILERGSKGVKLVRCIRNSVTGERSLVDEGKIYYDSIMNTFNNESGLWRLLTESGPVEFKMLDFDVEYLLDGRGALWGRDVEFSGINSLGDFVNEVTFSAEVELMSERILGSDEISNIVAGEIIKNLKGADHHGIRVSAKLIPIENDQIGFKLYLKGTLRM